MSKHPSLKPKRQLRNKTCLGQYLASKRKRENKQRKEAVSSEVARERYQSAISGTDIIQEYHSTQRWEFE